MSARHSGTPPEVVVVGGGVAGLGAATALAERGASVVLLEAKPALGGRVSSFVDPTTKARADNGQHIFMGCYDETFALLGRIGSASLVSTQATLTMDVVDAAGRASRLRCPALPAPVHLMAGLLRWNALGLADSLSAVRMALRRTPHPTETVAAWLARLRQSRRIVEVLWEPLALAALNQSIQVAAAMPFAVVLDRVLRTQSASTLVVPSAPLDALFADPARSYLLGRGATIRIGSPARVVFRPGEPPIVMAQDRSLRADSIIVAVPWHALSRVVEGPPPGVARAIQAAAETPGEAIVSAHLWFDRPAMDAPFVGLPGRAWQWAFDVGAAWSSRQPAARPAPPGPPLEGRVSLIASAANDMVGQSNDALRDLAVRVLHDAVPESRTARLRHAVVVRERLATFSVAPGLPARPDNDVGVPGVYLAGDWIGNSLPATIEAAVQSGHRAAALAARHLGL